MQLLCFVAAALLYAFGGLFMKQSDGLSRLQPTVAFLLLFAAAACLQAYGMKRESMGTSYMIVLGLEAIAVLALGRTLLSEHLTLPKTSAVLLILAGVSWLHFTH